MYLFETIYPYILAASNIGLGWVLYQFLESMLGAVLIAAGILVFLAVTARTANSHTSVAPLRNVVNRF